MEVRGVSGVEVCVEGNVVVTWVNQLAVSIYEYEPVCIDIPATTIFTSKSASSIHFTAF